MLKAERGEWGCGTCMGLAAMCPWYSMRPAHTDTPHMLCTSHLQNTPHTPCPHHACVSHSLLLFYIRCVHTSV